MKCLSIRLSIYVRFIDSLAHCITSLACNFLCTFAWIDHLHCISEVRIDQKLYEAARLRGYLHCFRLVLGVQKLYETVITSLSFHNPFEIGQMKRVRYLVEVLSVRYFAEVLGQCLRSSTFDDIVHRSRTE